MGMAAVTERERKDAFALFGQDVSMNEVAKQLFKGNWTKAKKLREAYDAQDGGGQA